MCTYVNQTPHNTAKDPLTAFFWSRLFWILNIFPSTSHHQKNAINKDNFFTPKVSFKCKKWQSFYILGDEKWKIFFMKIHCFHIGWFQTRIIFVQINAINHKARSHTPPLNQCLHKTEQELSGSSSDWSWALMELSDWSRSRAKRVSLSPTSQPTLI